MNIPLNIDWQQILLHMLNFVILAGGLYFLLYKPVKNFMDSRTSNIEKMKTDATEEAEKAEELKKQYEQKILNADAEIAEKNRVSVERAQSIADGIIKDAEAQKEEIIRSAETEAKRRGEIIIEDAREEIAQLATMAAEKILNDKTASAETNDESDK